MAMVMKCHCIDISKCSMRVEIKTPKIPPMLQMAWKEPTIFLVNFSCKEMDWVLIEMLMTRSAMEKTTNAAITVQRELVKPIANKDAMNKKLAYRSGIRLSYLEINHPERGMPIKALAGMVMSKLPKTSSLSWYWSLSVGMREAQDEKQIPDNKKKLDRATRCFCLVSKTE